MAKEKKEKFAKSLNWTLYNKKPTKFSEGNCMAAIGIIKYPVCSIRLSKIRVPIKMQYSDTVFIFVS